LLKYIKLDKQHTKEQINLIALWAFCESGLGGILHAIKLPFTGFIVGGFACIILMLLAEQFKHKPYQIIKATLLVIAIKFMVSPQAPLPAYIAVAFQGTMAWIIFGGFGRNLLSCMLFGSIALLESALQKFLLATLIYGKSLWEALDLFVIGLLKDFQIPQNFSFSYLLIAIYSLIYFSWGLFLGYKTYFLPQKLFALSSILPRFEPNKVTASKKRRKLNLKWMSLLLTLAFIALTFWFTEGTLHKGVYVIARTLFVLFILLFVVTPLLRIMLQKISKNLSSDNLFNLVSQQMEVFAERIQSIWEFSASKGNRIYRIWYFMEMLLAISLYPTDEN
jgi:hypothetical protein